MRKLLTFILTFLLAWSCWAQQTDASLTTDNDTNIRTKTYSPTRAANMFESLIDSKKSFYVDGTASGTDTYTVTVNSVVTSYISNVVFRIRFTNASTSTTPTLNVNGLGAKTIVTNAGGALTAGDLKAGGTYDLVYDGTNLRVMNVGGGGGGSLSNLTAATATNTINNTSYTQEWQWNTLGASTGLLLSSSATDAASNTQTVFRVNQTGANASSTQTTYSGYFSNTKTGTSSTNVGAFFTASGGTNNYAFQTGASTRINLGSVAGVPSGTLNNGDIWYDNNAGVFGIRSTSGTYQIMNGFSSVRANNRIPYYSTSTIGFIASDNFTWTGSQLTVNGAAVFGGTTITTNAALDIQSTTKAFKPPVMTQAERNAIVTPSQGFMVGNSTTGKPSYYDGFGWVDFVLEQSYSNTLTKEVAVNLGEIGSSATGSNAIEVNAFFSNKTALFVDVDVIAIKNDGTDSEHATIRGGRFRKNSSGTFSVDAAGTYTTSDASIIATIALEINGTNPQVAYTMGASSGTWQVSWVARYIAVTDP